MDNDLINRKALIEAFKEEFFGMYSDDFNYMIKWLEEFPASANIVKCNSCEYWDTEWIPAYGGEGHYCPMIDNVMLGDEWCCYGERRKAR